MKNKGIDGLYSALTARIRQQEDDGRVCVSVKSIVSDIQDDVDIHSVSMRWYIDFALRQAAETILNQLGYRSVVHGEGLFINPDKCTNSDYLKKLYNNAHKDEQLKKAIEEGLLKIVTKKVIPGQLSFDINGNIAEDITTEQLIQMLKDDAGVA